MAARVLVPAGGLPVRDPGAAGLVAGTDAGGARAAGWLDAAGPERRTAELVDRGGDRALRCGVPRAGRTRQGHGLGRGLRADDERPAGVGSDPPAARPLVPASPRRPACAPNGNIASD